LDSQRLVHGRLDLERQKQKDWREKSSQAGKKSGKVRREKSLQAEPTLDFGSSLGEPKMNSSSSSTSSSTSTEKTKKQKTSSKPKNVPDPRHTPFREMLGKYWKYVNPSGPEMPWDKREAGQLGNLLKASPDLTLEQFHELLRNRAKSDVAHGDRVYAWLGNITKFSVPLNEYGKAKNGNGGNYAAVPTGKTDVNVGFCKELIAEDQYRSRIIQDGFMQTGEAEQDGRAALFLNS
jgi:hypothetical protein